MDGMGWIVLWLAAIVLGVLALTAPLAAGVAVTIVVAWVLMVVGVLHAAAGLHAHRAKSRLAHFALGFLYVVTVVSSAVTRQRGSSRSRASASRQSLPPLQAIRIGCAAALIAGRRIAGRRHVDACTRRGAACSAVARDGSS